MPSISWKTTVKIEDTNSGLTDPSSYVYCVDYQRCLRLFAAIPKCAP